MSLFAGIVARWDAASLDTSVAPLARSRIDDFGAVPEEDSDSDLPRATFWLDDDVPIVHTTSYRLRSAVARFTVWHSSSALLETALDNIESLMDCSERAATNPMTISGGDLINVQFSARNSYPEDENVFRGYVDFELTWQKQLTTPA